MIEIISFALAFFYVPVSLIFLKKEPKLNEFIIVFISIIYILKCGFVLYKVIIEYQNNDLLVFIIVGTAAIGWISYEKIHHIFKIQN